MVKFARERDGRTRRLMPGTVRHRDMNRACIHPGWSVLPLSCHGPDEAEMSRSPRGGGALRADDATPPPPALRFVADVVAPVAEEKLAEDADLPVSAVAAPIFAEGIEGQLEALPSDGELAAFGALACILSAVAMISAVVWLMNGLA